MMNARREGHHEVAQKIADAGLSQAGYDAGLKDAVWSGRVADAKYFVDKGADHTQARYGVSLIHQAAGAGHVAMVQTLHEFGLSVDARTDDGDTPLHRAAAGGHHEVVEALLALGADSNAVSGDGSMPLSSTQDESIRKLLSGGGASTKAKSSMKADIKKKLKSVAKQVYAFRFTTEGGGPGASRFGGLPGMLRTEAWLMEGDTPLRFFAQVDFSDLPASGRKKYGERMLQVFLADDVPATGERGVLLRWVDTDKLIACAAPDGVEVFAPTAIADFKRATKDYPLNEPGLPAYDALGLHERQLLQQVNKSGDKTGGWPHWVQEADYPKCPQCAGAMDILLLQIDSGHVLDYSFGDNRAAYILACASHPDEIAFSYQCT